jgi:hypothetical protein
VSVIPSNLFFLQKRRASRFVKNCRATTSGLSARAVYTQEKSPIHGVANRHDG